MDLTDMSFNMLFISHWLPNTVRVSSFQLKTAYSPQGKYNLRDFHHAVNSLPTDGFIGAEECSTPCKKLSSHQSDCLTNLMEMSPETVGLLTKIIMMMLADEALAKLLSNEFLFSWGSKDIQKKAVLITSRLAPNMDSMHKLLKVPCHLDTYYPRQVVNSQGSSFCMELNSLEVNIKWVPSKELECEGYKVEMQTGDS